MQIKIYTVPVFDNVSYVDEMNVFLRSHKIIEMRKELVTTSDSSYWTFCISYLTSDYESYDHKTKTDYKQVLDADTFERFSHLRTIRKQLAIDDAVPAYAVFTDAELVAFAKQPMLGLNELKRIDGIGEKRIEKYGAKLVTLLQQTYEKSRISDGTNSEPGQLVPSLL